MELNEKCLKDIWEKVVKDCKVCGGTGSIKEPDIDGFPASKECECSGLATKYMNYAEAGIDEEYWRLTINDFEGDPLAKEKIIQYINTIDEIKKHGLGMILSGTNGTGKSFGGVLILKAAMEKKYSIQFVTMGELLDLIYEGHGNSERADIAKEDYEKIKVTDVIVLDNMGSEYMKRENKEFPISKLDAFFRYRGRNLLSTFITTNCSEDDFKETYGKSISSLLSARNEFLMVLGDDFREKILDKIKKMEAQ